MKTENEYIQRLIDLIDKLHRIPADFYINRELSCDKFILDVTEAKDCLTILKEYIPVELVSEEINPAIKEISLAKREITFKTRSDEYWEITFRNDQYDEIMKYYNLIDFYCGDCFEYTDDNYDDEGLSNYPVCERCNIENKEEKRETASLKAWLDSERLIK